MDRLGRGIDALIGARTRAHADLECRPQIAKLALDPDVTSGPTVLRRMHEHGEQHWKVGELARATGVTVRALHHYDSLGLLVPSERTYTGYRLYGTADVRRLYGIVALRRLGLRLHDRLLAIRDELVREGEPSIDQLFDTMEAITMIEKYYTDEQREQLARRREQLGEDQVEAGQRAWAEIFDELRSAKQAGTDPADAKLAPVRERAGGWWERSPAATPGSPIRFGTCGPTRTRRGSRVAWSTGSYGTTTCACAGPPADMQHSADYQSTGRVTFTGAVARVRSAFPMSSPRTHRLMAYIANQED